MEEETPKPTLREQFEQYKPVVTASISEDAAYRNACGHSDRENAVIEGNAAVRRAVLGSKDMELIRALYSDIPEFRQRLHREVIDETYPKLHELLRPLSQEDIDTALCAWNGNIESKHAVVRYMKDHASKRKIPLHGWLRNTVATTACSVVPCRKPGGNAAARGGGAGGGGGVAGTSRCFPFRSIAKWQTFPNAKAAEEASYEEYKANLRRNAQNFRITDEHLGEGGPKAKFQANINAIRLLKELEVAGQQASPEQQEVLSRYVGWGGLADAFDPEKPAWASEYAQLKELLTPEEYAAARSSTLNAHYTSPTVIQAIYEAVGRMGFETGNILEPSMGVGNFFGMLPEEMRNSRLYGVELDPVSGRIAKQLYPKADITVGGFETTDRRDFFDLAIGNVPFGQYQVNDKAYNKLNFSIHNYFFRQSTRPGASWWCGSFCNLPLYHGRQGFHRAPLSCPACRAAGSYPSA